MVWWLPNTEAFTESLQCNWLITSLYCTCNVVCLDSVVAVQGTGPEISMATDSYECRILYKRKHLVIAALCVMPYVRIVHFLEWRISQQLHIYVYTVHVQCMCTVYMYSVHVQCMCTGGRVHSRAVYISVCGLLQPRLLTVVLSWLS